MMSAAVLGFQRSRPALPRLFRFEYPPPKAKTSPDCQRCLFSMTTTEHLSGIGTTGEEFEVGLPQQGVALNKGSWCQYPRHPPLWPPGWEPLGRSPLVFLPTLGCICLQWFLTHSEGHLASAGICLRLNLCPSFVSMGPRDLGTNSPVCSLSSTGAKTSWGVMNERKSWKVHSLINIRKCS